MPLVHCFVAVLSALAVVAARTVVEKAQLPALAYPLWAHKHWVWLHNDLGNQENVTNLVKDYEAHNIKVGAVNIDSTWETGFNNFAIDTTKFSDIKALIDDMHSQDIKVIFWITSMVNVENDEDYQFALKNDFLLKNKEGVVRPIEWWHGKGALLDYTNPDAVSWWHAKMDLLLNLGSDGWKVDGVDPYVLEYALAGGATGHDGQVVSYRAYADMYYGDYFTYSRSRNREALIMARPVDCGLDQASKLCWGYAPKHVMTSGWVGDDDATFEGFRGCLRKVIYSAWDGYANFACDIGGYRGDSANPGKTLLLRWAQVSAFLPLMENGGTGEHRPFMFDEETTAIYRKFVDEHYRLLPYLANVGSAALEGATSSLKPLAQRGTPAAGNYSEPRTFAYSLGADVFVHPIAFDFAESGGRAGQMSMVRVDFPGDAAVVWADYWEPTDQTKWVAGGSGGVRREYSLASLPVFVRRGALMPLQSRADESVVFQWVLPAPGGEARLEYREPLESGSGAVVRALLSVDMKMVLSVSGRSGRYALEVVGVGAPASVDVDCGSPLPRCAHSYDSRSQTLRVECSDALDGVVVTAEGATV